MSRCLLLLAMALPCCADSLDAGGLVDAYSAATTSARTRAERAGQASLSLPCNQKNVSAKIIIYGGTAGGVVAAVAASRMLAKAATNIVPPQDVDLLDVVLINPSTRLGGMVSSGLGHTDGKDSGGIAKEFFQAAGGYNFAPSTAERVFNELVANASVHVASSCDVDSLRKNGQVLQSIVTTGGGIFTAQVFIDSSYEGDLLSAANVSFIVGREAAAQYNEVDIGGRLPAPPLWGCRCNWEFGDVNGVGDDGLPLPMIQTTANNLSPLGSPDNKSMAYNFRLCMTRNTSNFAPVPSPTNYSSARWELLRRVFQKRGGLRQGGGAGWGVRQGTHRNLNLSMQCTTMFPPAGGQSILQMSILRKHSSFII